MWKVAIFAVTVAAAGGAVAGAIAGALFSKY